MPANPGPPPYRDHLKQDTSSRKSLSSFSPIPEEEDQFTLSDHSDDDHHINSSNSSSSEIKLRRIEHSRHSSAASKPAAATAYAYNNTRPSDVEAYLSSITEAERELLTSAQQFELSDSDDSDDSDARSVGSDVGLKKGSRTHRRKSSSFKRHTPHMGWGWTTTTKYYYRKVWWRALVVVVVVLGTLVWVFLRFAAGRGWDGGRGDIVSILLLWNWDLGGTTITLGMV